MMDFYANFQLVSRQKSGQLEGVIVHKIVHGNLLNSGSNSRRSKVSPKVIVHCVNDRIKRTMKEGRVCERAFSQD